MARKSASITHTTTNVAGLKTGSVIWVPYRKSPRWPAVIKNVYPKKITYFFLPEPQTARPPTFKTTPKSVTLFKESDVLPANASKDLQEAYKAALGIVQGGVQLRYTQSRKSTTREPVSPTPSTSNNSSLAEVPTKKPRLMNDVDMNDFVVNSTVPDPPASSVEKRPKLGQSALSLSNLSLSSSKNNIFKAMLSYEAREHVEKIWAEQIPSGRNASYTRAQDASEACFTLYCGNLLSFVELEMVTSEVHNWIVLSPKLPKMSLLGEFHYISKVVLPELCIFALMRINNLSAEEAEIQYQKAMGNKKDNAECNNSSFASSHHDDSVASDNDSPHSSIPKTGNSFEQLLRAVSIERSK